MAENIENLEEVVQTQLLRLNATVQGLVVGIVVGTAIFAATNWLILKGGPIGPSGEPIIGPHLSLLGHFFIGYRVTFVGSLIGAFYGCLIGFVLGYFISRTYNWVVGLRERRN